MRLVDLDPRWAEHHGRRVGFTFQCPHCQGVRLFAKSEPMPMHDQIDMFERDWPELTDKAQMVPAREEFAWVISGTDFASISVTPSIDASASGHWHGFVTNGEIK